MVVAYDRFHDVDACIASIRAQTLPACECVVVLNGASDATRAVVERHAEQDERIRPVITARMSASAARNLACEHVRAPLVHFLDDDVILPPELFDVVKRAMDEHPEVGIFGGPNLTPPDEPPFCQMTGALLAGRFGTGIARARYRRLAPGPAEECDLILCNLVVRRTVLDQGIVFPGLFGGEENVLMGHARSRGIAMWYSPDAWVHHRRRRDLRSYWEQVTRYGAGRANAMALAPHTVRLAYFVPTAFVAYLVALPLAVWITPWAWAPLGAYVALDLIASVATSATCRKPSWIPALLLLHLVTHVGYGIGFARRLAALGVSRTSREDASPAR